MNPFERLAIDFSESSNLAVAEAHGAAVAIGGNVTFSTAADEQLCSAQDLLCLAADAAVDLAMLAQIFDAAEDTGEHVRLLSEAASAVSRLSSRALEVHARDTGYDREIWVERAVEETQFLLFADSDPLFDGLRSGGSAVALARGTASSLHAALACAPADRMGVPGHIAAALGASVAVFMIARAAEDDG